MSYYVQSAPGHLPGPPTLTVRSVISKKRSSSLKSVIHELAGTVCSYSLLVDPEWNNNPLLSCFHLTFQFELENIRMYIE